MLLPLLLAPTLSHAAPAQPPNPWAKGMALVANRPTTSASQGALLGAGFFVGPHTLVTAYHVIKGASRLDITEAFGCSSAPNYQSKNFKILGTLKGYISPAQDLAVLFLPDQTTGCAHLSTIPTGPTTPLYTGDIVGNPYRNMSFRTRVNFSYPGPHELFVPLGKRTAALSTSTPETLVYVIDGSILPGMSGGPLLVDGIAIGVVSGQWGGGANGSGPGWAIPISSQDINMTPTTYSLPVTTDIQFDPEVISGGFPKLYTAPETELALAELEVLSEGMNTRLGELHGRIVRLKSALKACGVSVLSPASGCLQDALVEAQEDRSFLQRFADLDASVSESEALIRQRTASASERLPPEMRTALDASLVPYQKAMDGYHRAHKELEEDTSDLQSLGDPLKMSYLERVIFTAFATETLDKLDQAIPTFASAIQATKAMYAPLALTDRVANVHTE